MSRICVCFSLFFVFCCSPCFAQSAFDFTRTFDIKASADGQELPFPWIGGINSPQFSNIDLNFDGKQDLFMFDRTDNVVTTFIVNNENKLEHAPIYEEKFPAVIAWALLRDFNNDGVADLFSATAGDLVQVHTGSVSGEFVVYTEPPTIHDIFVASTDIPAIGDVNGDGRVDILTFDDSGTFLVLYANTSAEGASVPRFERVDECWGEFYELGNSPDLVLNSCIVGGLAVANEDGTKSGVHPGSTLSLIDSNGDGLTDVLLGDNAFDKITHIENGGSTEEAFIVSQDSNFPSYNESVDLQTFPATFLLDVNADGNEELLVTPNNPVASEHYFCVWAYNDLDEGAGTNFSLDSKSFLVDQTLDHSRIAIPTFFDYNNDGLMDLVVGNFGSSWFETVNNVSSLTLYENTGTSEVPAFKLITRDYLGLAMFGLESLYPTFGDLDGDGLKDLVLGTSTPTSQLNGTLIHLPNTSSDLTGEAKFGNPEFLFQGIDVVQYSAPQIVDVDRDGKNDMVIGQRNGLLHYYRNTSEGSLSFEEIDDELNGWGDLSVVVAGSGSSNGYSSPFLCDLDEDGNWELLVGSENDGYLFLYDDIENNLEGGPFNEVSAQFLGADTATGQRMAITLSQDLIPGKWVMLIGNRKGGLQFWETPGPIGIDNETVLENTIRLFPNPVHADLNISSPEDFESLAVWNSNGRLVSEQLFSTSLNVRDLPAGIYFLELRGEHRRLEKFLIAR